MSLLALPAALLLSGTATAVPARDPSHDRASGPARAVAGTLADFPLDAGYGGSYDVTDRPGMGRFALCGRTAWDPRDGTHALIGVRVQEPESVRGRTLVRYRSRTAAKAAVARARAAVAACPEERDDEDYGVDHTLRDDVTLGRQSVVWIDRYPQPSAGGAYDPGLVVSHVVRVGRTVLASFDYGEGNGTPRSRERSIADATAADRPVVAAMADLD